MVGLPDPSKIVDAGLNVFLPIHSYLGMSAIVTDYLPRRKFGLIYTISKGFLIVVTTTTAYGLYKLNTENIGFSALVKKVWRESKEQHPSESS